MKLNIKEKNFVVAKDTSSFAKANLMATDSKKFFSLIFLNLYLKPLSKKINL